MTSLRRTPLLVALLLLAALAGWVAPANAGTAHHPRHHAGGYLALGDSVPFGFTPFAATPPETYLDAGNFVGYPELLARRGLRPLANASCAGETTGSFLDVTAPSNGCTNVAGAPGGYRAVYPLHVDYAGSQLQYAVDRLRSHPRTRLVTLMIGANDLFLCERLTASGCAGDDFTALLQQVGGNVATIVSALRSEAGYRGRIVIVTYHSLDYSDATATAAIAALDQALVAAAQPYGVRVADGYGAFARASAAYGGDTCAAGLRIPLPTGGCDIHPSLAGQRRLAHAVRWALHHRSAAA